LPPTRSVHPKKGTLAIAQATISRAIALTCM
jgi:hypothetical protein